MKSCSQKLQKAKEKERARKRERDKKEARQKGKKRDVPSILQCTVRGRCQWVILCPSQMESWMKSVIHNPQNQRLQKIHVFCWDSVSSKHGSKNTTEDNGSCCADAQRKNMRKTSLGFGSKNHPTRRLPCRFRIGDQDLHEVGFRIRIGPWKIVVNTQGLESMKSCFSPQGLFTVGVLMGSPCHGIHEILLTKLFGVDAGILFFVQGSTMFDPPTDKPVPLFHTPCRPRTFQGALDHSTGRFFFYVMGDLDSAVSEILSRNRS